MGDWHFELRDKKKGLKKCLHCKEQHEAGEFRWVTIAGQQFLFCKVCADAYDDGTLYTGGISTRYKYEEGLP